MIFLDEDDNVKELTHIITEIIQDNTVIDWTFKDDVKREMGKRIKRQLRASNSRRSRQKVSHGS
ncbi:type I restriction enzyme endonuclease domain-containing protein [Lentibacillus salicampi]|uniref:type I restriction enzyme endonuclease domain-containing protein n=1 Tax=Lentibacillus salicampi TaxID=175306 RepID=UPI001FD82BF1|nr:type I restriction enzyme endonuclease domain-containing protein [Lentibacillus salicampi]